MKTIAAMFVSGIVALALLSACAPPGYHYKTGGFTQIPNDPCVRWSSTLNSAGTLSKLNATVGKEGGVPSEVESIADLAAPDTIQLASVGITMPLTYSESLWCHVTLNFTNHTSDSGMLEIAYPGKYAALQISWISDEEIAKARAKTDRLYTSKNLLVKPDLTTPEIQRCVGRRTALGQGEDFPGQLWAACAANGPPH